MLQTYSEKFKRSLSKVAFGGIVVANEVQEDANRYVEEAIKSGVNYFDVAPTYFDAESKLGPALRGKRKDIFLACKTEDRTASGSRKLLEESLEKLETDYFDLYQLHAVYDLEDVKKTFGPDGAFKTYLKAKEEGLIKHIGFSAHSTEAALALMERYDFDSIMFPFNFASMLNYGYGNDVLKLAKEKNMTILGIKSMVLTSYQESDKEKYPKAWYHPIEDFELAKKAVNYSLNRGVDIIVPPGNIEQFRWAIKIVEQGLQLDASDVEVLKKVASSTTPLFPLKSR